MAANASPEPFSNWALSLLEDIFVVALGFVTLKYPLRRARRERWLILRRWLWPPGGSGAGCVGPTAGVACLTSKVAVTSWPVTLVAR